MSFETNDCQCELNTLCANCSASYFQDPVFPDETVIVIRSLVPDGAAEQDGRLHPGHRLMSVNDTNLEHATLDIAVQTLKSTERGMRTCQQYMYMQEWTVRVVYLIWHFTVLSIAV